MIEEDDVSLLLAIFGAPSSTPGGQKAYAPYWLFCMKLNPEQLLFETFFDKMHIFGSIEA